jgi:dephospho-CoA kinase
MATTSSGASSPSRRRVFAVGLTGGIGSGKSAAADALAALGAAIVDSDVIAHRLTAAGGEAIAPIACEFGREYVGADGSLDRQRMRELVFRDPAARRRLEAILHPRIGELALAAAGAAADRAPYVVFVVPLLVESGTWRSRVDRLLVVDCSAATQVARVQARSGLAADLARSIIAQQASRAERLRAADDILVNEGRLEQLAARVRRLHLHYFEHARKRADAV